MTSDVRRSMRGGSTLTYLRADYDELAQVRARAARVADNAERLDFLINNAGLAGPNGTFTSVGEPNAVDTFNIVVF